MFVIDASIALSWCFQDEASSLADAVLARLTAEEAVTSAIWPLEVANGLRTAERRGRLHPGELPRLRLLLSALPIHVERTDLSIALGEVLEAARSFGLTAYDASYLRLALQIGIPLATTDANLSAACRQAGASVLEA